MNRSITNAVIALAQGAGTIGSDERYRDKSESGTLIGNGQIPGQYTSAVGEGPVKVVLMDGGGNDCLQQSNPQSAVDGATEIFGLMEENGTEDIVYFFYPDPVGDMFPHLKPCLDEARPQIKALCDGLQTPRCYFIDLRDMWQDSYVGSDGIHPTEQGGQAVAEVVWDVMVDNCIAQ